MNRKIASHYTLINGALERNIVVEIDDTGLILNIERCLEIDNLAHVEFHPGILIPGMVNAHCHLELSYLHGAIPEATGFAGFAREIGVRRNNYTMEERLHAASVADAAMYYEGVVAVADIANDELTMPIKERSKIEYHTLFELFGLTLEATTKHHAMATRHKRSFITPHSTYSLQDAIFKESCSMGEGPLSIHFLESDDEAALYRHEGSLNAWYTRMGWECDFLHYGTPTKRVVESIPKERRAMLVHGCKASKTDVMTLDSHFTTPPTWVLCPESNRYISGIKPPVALFEEVAAHIAIGTDSLASARSISMLDNMRQIEGVSLATLLTWATQGGARALGIEDRYGMLEVGKRPGLVVIADIDIHNLSLLENSYATRIA